VSKKGVLDIAERPKRAFWQTLLENLHLDAPNTRNHRVKVNYEVEVDGLSSEQLQAIVDAWQGEDHDANNYGFDLSGESGSTYWLDHAFVKDDVMVDVQRQNEEIVTAVSLLEGLWRHRRQLLGRANS
jgi:hypothetical protein